MNLIYIFTSRKNSQCFDVNKRIIYTMHACGQGYSGIEKFTSLMNIPKPMTANNYDKIVTILSDTVKTVAHETMFGACEEIRSQSSVELRETIVDTAISCDGSWQRRGFALLNGVVTAISMENGTY